MQDGCLRQAKTGVEGAEQAGMVRDMVREYVKGLCWVMRYYYEGARRAALPPTPSYFWPLFGSCGATRYQWSTAACVLVPCQLLQHSMSCRAGSHGLLSELPRR